MATRVVMPRDRERIIKARIDTHWRRRPTLQALADALELTWRQVKYVEEKERKRRGIGPARKRRRRGWAW